jgi:hypothetical protein
LVLNVEFDGGEPNFRGVCLLVVGVCVGGCWFMVWGFTGVAGAYEDGGASLIIMWVVLV